MPYGLTPSDKKSYKESKLRRKQALNAYESGKIQPLHKSRKSLFLVIILVVFLVSGIFAYAVNVFSVADSNRFVQDEISNAELLKIINKSAPVGSDYKPDLIKYGAFDVNKILLPYLENMISDAKDQGINLELNSAYISFDEQESLYKNELNKLLENSDISLVRAESEVQKHTPKGGNSEFQTGLLIEFKNNSNSVRSYLEKNCIEYGFIQRYTDDKQPLTKMAENSYIYRYVGINNAENMRSLNMCLEEYTEYINQQQTND